MCSDHGRIHEEYLDVYDFPLLEFCENTPPRPILVPPEKSHVDRVPLPVSFGNLPPLASGLEKVEDPVEDASVILAFPASLSEVSRKERFDCRKLLVSDELFHT